MKTLLAALAVFGSATAERLLVASYGNQTHLGTIATLELLPSTGKGSSRELKVIHESQDCGSLPTWLDVSLGPNTVICLDEAATDANMTTLSVEPDGSLKKVASVGALGGAVSLQSYNDKSAVALAHYGPNPAITSYSAHGDSTFESLQNITFGEPDQIHQAVLDPTGKFMIFPSLGADLVRVYSIDASTGLLTEQEPLKSKTGYGPRHAVFWTGSESRTTYLFVLHELSSRIVSYKVDYPDCGGLSFTQVDEVSTYGNQPLPDRKLSGAEIVLSPCNNFLVASNRNGTIFSVDNADPKNSTQIPSDSLVTFKPTADGKLSFVQLAKSGGWFPRHFMLSKDGSMVAVANQLSHNVVIYSRDVETGLVNDQKMVARAENLGPGDLMFIQWLEG
ncbi:3-carboxymuconate cyclase [Stemphylium lycopersici]|uniref:3-carboxymuconate cyclase n=1 Tax=Stemphylium lycopersici TaxID=183478 RepID=A0A364MYQ8_STELY|nr:3-carboxymuconate cyclase [Stemphylium lycopersici]